MGNEFVKVRVKTVVIGVAALTWPTVAVTNCACLLNGSSDALANCVLNTSNHRREGDSHVKLNINNLVNEHEAWG